MSEKLVAYRNTFSRVVASAVYLSARSCWQETEILGNNQKLIFGCSAHDFRTLSTNKWHSLVDKTFHVSKGPFWRIFWNKVCVHLFVRKLSKRNLNFWWYVFWRVVVPALYMCRVFYLKKMFFWKRNDFPKLFLEVERMDYGRLLKDFELAHLPVLFACTEELFGGQFFWKKNNLVINFCVLSQKNFIVCQKYFRMVAAIAVQKSRGTSMGRNPIPEKLCNSKTVFGIWVNCLRTFCWKCFCRVAAPALYVCRGVLWGLIFERSITNIITSGLWAKQLFAYGNTFSRVVASAVYFSCRRLLLLCTCAKQHFEDFFRTKYSLNHNFCTLSEKMVAYRNTFRRIVASAVYYSAQKCWQETLFLKKQFNIEFQILSLSF